MKTSEKYRSMKVKASSLGGYRRRHSTAGARGPFRDVSIAVASLVVVCLAAHAEAGIILTLNTFADTNDTAFAKENVVGTPTLTLTGSGGISAGTAFTDADGTNHAATLVANWTDTTSGAAQWVLDLDTTGFADLSLRFDNRSSSATSAASAITIAWAVNGSGSFTDVETVSLNSLSQFTGYSVDLTGISVIENASSVQLRGLWSNDGTGPNTRLDNLQLTGTAVAVPEPSSLSLLGLSTVGLLLRRRWRKRTKR